MLIDNYVKSQRDKMKNNNSTNYQNNYQTNNGYDGTLQNSQENYAEPILLSNDTQYSELETNSKLAETVSKIDSQRIRKMQFPQNEGEEFDAWFFLRQKEHDSKIDQQISFRLAELRSTANSLRTSNNNLNNNNLNNNNLNNNNLNNNNNNLNNSASRNWNAEYQHVLSLTDSIEKFRALRNLAH